MAINAQHPEYQRAVSLWQEISDIVNGENLKKYLVELNPQDTSEDNKKRNKQYRERAIFYAVAGWTVRGMLGAMFTKWPTFIAPPSMEYLKFNADGAGQSIYQQSQAVSVDVISNGRAGLCVSYPEKPEGGALSLADINSGRYVATIHKYAPEQIINWSTKKVGAQIILSLVCTTETETVIEDYEHVSTKIIRERFINDVGQYEEIVWKEVKGDNGVIGWVPGESKIPTQSDGKPWNIIPFQFVGSESNTPDVNLAPMKELVHVNIGHYRNSADFEDSVWYSGQAQPWMSGITQAHIDLMKKNDMYVGSRNLIGVPSGEQLNYASAPSNPLVAQAMKNKIELMIGLGARFLAPGTAVKTATQAEGELSMQHSVLSLIASNVSEAYTQCLKWCALFMGEAETDLAYTISQEFVKTVVDANMLREMVASWLQGAMPAADLFNWMRKNELIDPEKTDEDINEELASNPDRITAEI
jgi:hypothetical protein